MSVLASIYRRKCSTKVFLCFVSESVFTTNLHYNRGDLLSFAKKSFLFWGILTVVFV